MNQLFYREIETAWGTGVIAFNRECIWQIILPEKKYKMKITPKTDSLPTWLKSVEQKIVDYFNGKKVGFSLAHIDLTGYTDFERAVYKALSKVRYGETISYMQLSGKAGSTRASRAVGSTMAKNRIPLIMPCHRVIKSNGDIGLFGYGKNYKIRMLKLEKSNLE